MRLLVVEDSKEMQLMIAAVLRQIITPEITINYASTLNEAQTEVSNHLFDLIILDLDLPDGTGLTLMSQAETRPEARTAVFILSGHKDISSKVAAFSLGAEDFIEKPFVALEFKARIQGKLDRILKAQQLSRVKSYEDVLFDYDQHKCFSKEGIDLDLTSSEFKILSLFVQHPDRVYSRAQILDLIRGQQFHVSERTIDTHILNLRKKLEAKNIKIETVVGLGYRLASKASK